MHGLQPGCIGLDVCHVLRHNSRLRIRPSILLLNFPLEPLALTSFNLKSPQYLLFDDPFDMSEEGRLGLSSPTSANACLL